jgi:hypothetical protein
MEETKKRKDAKKKIKKRGLRPEGKEKNVGAWFWGCFWLPLVFFFWGFFLLGGTDPVVVFVRSFVGVFSFFLVFFWFFVGLGGFACFIFFFFFWFFRACFALDPLRKKKKKKKERREQKKKE